MRRHLPAASKHATVTLRDVALAAGVSPMTVSNVLNARPGATSAATQARVMLVVEQLGYRPDASARRLRMEQKGVVGLIIVDEQPDYLRDPFITNVVSGLGNAATRYGISLLLQGLHPARLASAPILARLETDAVCVMPSGGPAARRTLMDLLRKLRQPIVLLQDARVADLPDLCRVRQDDRAGGAALGAHLRGLLPPGSTVLLLRPGATWSAQQERAAGLRAALRGHAQLVALRCGDEGHADTSRALGNWLDRHPRPAAVVGGNDQMALAALQLLRTRGIAVPAETRVASFNGFELFRYAVPRLTTVVSPAAALGERAMEEVIGRMATGAFASPEVVLPVVLRLGDSA